MFKIQLKLKNIYFHIVLLRLILISLFLLSIVSYYLGRFGVMSISNCFYLSSFFRFNLLEFLLNLMFSVQIRCRTTFFILFYYFTGYCFCFLWCPLLFGPILFNLIFLFYSIYRSVKNQVEIMHLFFLTNVRSYKSPNYNTVYKINKYSFIVNICISSTSTNSYF